MRQTVSETHDNEKKKVRVGVVCTVRAGSGLAADWSKCCLPAPGPSWGFSMKMGLCARTSKYALHIEDKNLNVSSGGVVMKRSNLWCVTTRPTKLLRQFDLLLTCKHFVVNFATLPSGDVPVCLSVYPHVYEDVHSHPDQAASSRSCRPRTLYLDASASSLWRLLSSSCTGPMMLGMSNFTWFHGEFRLG